MRILPRHPGRVIFTGMEEKPKRRWFRFRLSTVLILTAIAAWGMALQPWATTHYEHFTQPFQIGGIGLSFEWSGARAIARRNPNVRRK